MEDVAKSSIENAGCDFLFETDDSYHFEDLVMNSISNLSDLIHDLKDELSGFNEEGLTYALNNRMILVKLTDIAINDSDAPFACFTQPDVINYRYSHFSFDSANSYEIKHHPFALSFLLEENSGRFQSHFIFVILTASFVSLKI